MSVPTLMPNPIPVTPMHGVSAGAPSTPRPPMGPATMAMLPPLSRGGNHGDALSPDQRRLMIAGILAAHVAGVYGLMQLDEVRVAVLQATPMLFDLIAPSAPPALPAPPPPPVRPQPVLKRPPPPALVIAAATSPAPAAFVVPAPPPPEPIEAPAPPAPTIVVATPASPAPPPAPKIIPASAVQYLEAPVLVYPRLSERNGERGRVMVRVYIDVAGLPQDVQVSVSSGYSRLDEAAVSSVRKARFKPYTENGVPTSGWAIVPASFE